MYDKYKQQPVLSYCEGSGRWSLKERKKIIFALKPFISKEPEQLPNHIKDSKERFACLFYAVVRQISMLFIIIIMYMYHALINVLSAHMIHINLNMIFYTHVKHSPTKTIYIDFFLIFFKALQTRTHTHTHPRAHPPTHTYTDCSRNWVLILVRMEILWEEEGFQFGFKRWQGWAVSKVLWEWIPNVGSKVRESAEAMSLAFVLLDFQHAGVRGRA